MRTGPPARDAMRATEPGWRGPGGDNRLPRVATGCEPGRMSRHVAGRLSTSSSMELDQRWNAPFSEPVPKTDPSLDAEGGDPPLVADQEELEGGRLRVLRAR